MVKVTYSVVLYFKLFVAIKYEDLEKQCKHLSFFVLILSIGKTQI